MATYPVNPNDPTSPTDQQGAKQGAEELRAIKALLAALVVAGSASASPRHTIVGASQDANGFNNAITVGAGLRPGLTASVASPYQLTFANGFTLGKAIDSSESITLNNADILGADLPINNTAYIFREYATAYGSTLVPWQDSPAFDRAQNTLLHFEDGVTPTCGFGNLYTITGAVLNNTKPAYGAKSMDASGGAGTNANVKRCETTAINSLGTGSWEAQNVVWFDVQPNAAVVHDMFAACNNGGFGALYGWFETGGNRRAFLQCSSTGAAHDIINATGATNLTVGVWYRFRAVFNALAGTYKLYVAAGGSAAAPVWGVEVEECTAASTARVCTITKVIWGCLFNGGYTQGISGFIDEARLLRAATAVAIVTPGVAPNTYPLSITAHPVYWMDTINYKMFQVTAESVAANANPTLTTTLRQFIAECDTSGVAVTAVRNYAIQGKYTSTFGAVPAVATRQAYTANIGTQNITGEVWLKNLTTELTYTPGMMGQALCVSNAAFPTPSFVIAEDKNTISIVGGSNATGWAVVNRNTGAYATITLASWQIQVRVKRTW